MHEWSCIVAHAPFRGERSDIINDLFELWWGVWSQTFSEIDPGLHLASDKFSCQDEIISLFHAGRPLAMGTIKSLDLSLDIDRSDSFIRSLPDSFRNDLLDRGAKIMVGGYLTVAPAARGMRQGFPTIEILVGLMMRYFLFSGAEQLVATMRSDIPAYATALQLGARVAARSAMHNVPVVAVVASRATIAGNPDPLVDDLIDDLWISREDSHCALVN